MSITHSLVVHNNCYNYFYTLEAVCVCVLQLSSFLGQAGLPALNLSLMILREYLRPGGLYYPTLESRPKIPTVKTTEYLVASAQVRQAGS